MTGSDDELLASLEATHLYSIGAFFCDEHPDLVEDVLAASEAMERDGLERWAAAEGESLDQAYRTLMTGLAIRYFKAVAGASA